MRTVFIFSFQGANAVTATLIILGIVVVTALAFDFTNGFHDTANAMATSIATGALKPFTAVAISAVLNLVGAFLSVNVAATVAKGIVNLDSYDLSGAAADTDGQALLMVVFTGLIGGIIWNLFTWLLGMPSSSSHALFGGLIGAAFAAMGRLAWSGPPLPARSSSRLLPRLSSRRWFRRVPRSLSTG